MRFREIELRTGAVSTRFLAVLSPRLNLILVPTSQARAAYSMHCSSACLKPTKGTAQRKQALQSWHRRSPRLSA